jgi:hypothetical protein
MSTEPRGGATFATDWLDLREPADLAARDPALLAAAASWLQESRQPVAVDLGAGTGSTLRAFADHAPAIRWRLIDRDARLLASARKRCGKQVQTLEADLADVGSLSLDGARLVTTSALLDLVSQSWLARLADRLAAEAIGFYAALTYDGTMRWSSDDPDDAAVLAAFNRDQRRDKGFGTALGPDAASRLVVALQARGFATRRAPSHWRLAPGPLQARLVQGVAAAASASGCVEAASWETRRLQDGATCHVGHWDVLALPEATGRR